MEQKAWESCQSLCASDPISQDSTDRLVRRWVGDEDIGQKRNHVKVELRHLILVENLVHHRVLGHLLAVDQAIHEAGQEHEHEGVQQQTHVAGDAVGGADPRAEQAAGQLEGLGVRDQEKHDKGHDILAHVTVHFVLFIENKI